MAITALPVTLTLKTAVHSYDNSYQSEFLSIQDNVYSDYRTVFVVICFING